TSTSTSAVGILMDGNVETLNINSFAATQCSRGILVQNTAGATAPQFISGYNVQIDFPYAEGVLLQSSIRSVLFTDIYINNSRSADNFSADSTVSHVSIQGGKCTSAFNRGIFLDGRYCVIANMQVSSNSKSGS